MPSRWPLAEVLAALPIETQPVVQRLLAEAERTDTRLHLVGGPVRDWVLGRPIRDVDLLVEPDADEASRPDASPALRLAETVCGTAGRVIAHGRFGTVRLEDEGAHVDLASARRERYRRPGALPEVEIATRDEDLARRDFSVNAMSMELRRGGGDATIHDPLAGLADLQAGRLRVLHARSFHDDPTRALRAARLAGRLGFALARPTRAALRDALRDGAFGSVSGERFRRELQRCFSDARLGLDPVRALRALAQWHVLPALEPGLELPRAAVAPLRRFGRFVVEPLWRSTATPPWQAGMAVWLAALPRPLARRTLARLSIRGDVAGRIADFPRWRDRIGQRLDAARGRGAVDALLASASEAQLQALWAWSDPADRRRIVRWAAEDRPRRSPIGGADVTALGLAGPDVGRVLARVRAAALDGEVANREEAIALASELAKRPARPGRGSAAKSHEAAPRRHAAKSKKRAKKQAKRAGGEAARKARRKAGRKAGRERPPEA